MRRFVLFGLGLGVLLTAGCQGTSFEKTITLGKDLPYHETEFRGGKSDQTVTVTAKSEAPVIVYLLLADNKFQAITALQAGQKPRKILAGGEALKDATLEGKVPAGQGFIVLIQPAEKGKEVEVALAVRGH